MKHLKEMPGGTIWPHLLLSIEFDVMHDLREYAMYRAEEVKRWAETSELAALMVDKYCDGLVKAMHIVGIDSSVGKEAISLSVRLIRTAIPIARCAGLQVQPRFHLLK